MSRVLVSGAAGYIGVPLCKALLIAGHEVVALDRLYFGEAKLAVIVGDPKLTVLRDDIRYFDERLLKDIDCVIDLAGLSNDASAEIDPDWTQQINFEGGERLARMAKGYGIKRYIYSSSAGVYGLGAKQSLSEEDNLNPQTAYARSKVHVENVLSELQSNSFETVRLRNATVFGLAPRMRFDLAINIMAMRAWKDKTIYVMGGGEQWRPFIHVEDVVRCFMACLDAPSETVSGECFNVGDDRNNYQIKQLAQVVSDRVPDASVHMIPDDPDKRTYHLSFKKLKEQLDFETTYTVLDGVDEILAALGEGKLDPDDPTCFTLQWYKALVEWDARIKELSMRESVL